MFRKMQMMMMPMMMMMTMIGLLVSGADSAPDWRLALS